MNLPPAYATMYAIQDLQNAMVQDSKGLWYFSRQSNNAYFMYAADRFKNALSNSISVYNVLAGNSSANISREYLYQCYVDMKSGSNQLLSVDLNLYPSQLAVQVRPLQMQLGQHMADFESYLFFR